MCPLVLTTHDVVPLFFFRFFDACVLRLDGKYSVCVTVRVLSVRSSRQTPPSPTTERKLHFKLRQLHGNKREEGRINNCGNEATWPICSASPPAPRSPVTCCACGSDLCFFLYVPLPFATPSSFCAFSFGRERAFVPAYEMK